MRLTPRLAIPSILATLLVGGCDNPPPKDRDQAPGAPPAPPPSLRAVDVDSGKNAKTTTRHQLQARLMGFADRYLNRMSEAMDRAATANPTQVCKVSALATKYYPGLTVVTVASEAEPEVALLDMVVVVTLERMVWQGDWAKEVFGDQAPDVHNAQQEMEDDIWRVATSVMKPDQVKDLRGMIDEWHSRNRERKYVSSTRFDDIEKLRQRQSQQKFELDVLAPVSEAAHTLEETRILGERTLFMVGRMPLLLHWQTELLLQEATAKPEVQQLVADAHSFATATQELTGIANRWPEDLARERALLLKELENQERSLSNVVGTVRSSIEEARKLTDEIDQITLETAPVLEQARALTDSVHESLVVADHLATKVEAWTAHDPQSAPGRPFDIREYRDTVKEFESAMEEFNKTLAQAEGKVNSPAVDAMLKRLDELMIRRVEHVGAQVRASIWDLFWAGAALVGLATIGSIIAGFVKRRAAPAPPGAGH